MSKFFKVLWEIIVEVTKLVILTFKYFDAIAFVPGFARHEFEYYKRTTKELIAFAKEDINAYKEKRRDAKWEKREKAKEAEN